MTLTKGAIISNIKRQSGGWWEGTVAANGTTGMFPDNFVRVLDSDDKSPVVLRYYFSHYLHLIDLLHSNRSNCNRFGLSNYRDKSESKNRRFKAVYSYTQNNNDELTLTVGDIIEFLGEVEEGWWRGKLSGKIGVFPSNFVEACAEASPVLVNRRLSNNSDSNSNNTNSRNEKNTINSNEERHDNSVSVANDKDAPSLPPKPGK